VAWGPVSLAIKEAVREFFSRQDGGLLVACPHRSGLGDVYRKAPPMISIGRLMPGDFWIGWNSVARTLVFLTNRFQEGVL
jgi:hypothetical protein